MFMDWYLQHFAGGVRLLLCKRLQEKEIDCNERVLLWA
jgi:hypothetical protein